MVMNTMSIDARIKENISKYDLDALYDTKMLHEHLRTVAELLNVDLMLTNKDRSQLFCAGNIKDLNFDAASGQSRRIVIRDYTVATLYVKDDNVAEDKAKLVNKYIEELCRLLEAMGEQAYMRIESSKYIDELEEGARLAAERKAQTEKIDSLTGVSNSVYFKKRVDILDRSEVAPIAVIEANINDWRYANDNFGNEGSDRLIKIISDIIKNEAKPEYVIGRIDGDVFAILIPMPEDNEAEEYVNQIQNKCNTYDDPQLTPSIACGIAYKENVEEKIADKLSDAEYLMFENKLETKACIDYQRRLHRLEK